MIKYVQMHEIEYRVATFQNYKEHVSINIADQADRM